MPKLNVLVAGSTGYIGIQLIKILLKHDNVLIKYLCGNSSIGKKISSFDNYFKKKKLPKIVKFEKSFLKNVDLILQHYQTEKLKLFQINYYIIMFLIDLAADFRLNRAKDYLKWYKQEHKAPKNIRKSIYALPEFSKNKIKEYNIISCPGCYPTSILLPLLPLIKKKIIKTNNIIIDSKSGYSGAGRNVHKKYQNKNLYDSLSAYGVGFHRHNSEIDQEISKVTNKKFKFTFTPHLTPMFRGILSTIYVETKNSKNINSMIKELKKTFFSHRFVKILKPNTLLSTNDVINSNNCHISICKTKYKNKYIILSVIDNLIKGGAGQAVQNMNLKFNFPEYKGF